MYISLPTIDLTNNNQTDYKTYNNVQIKAFENNDDMKQMCKFIENDNLDYNYKFSTNNNITYGDKITTDACATLYTGDNGFCAHVKNERDKIYGDDISIAYGPLNEDLIYNDCNCENSILRQTNIKTYNNVSNYTIDDDTIVQNFDQKCSLLGNNVYKTFDKFVNNLCINLNDQSNSQAIKDGIIKNKQSCNINLGGQSTEPTEPTEPTEKSVLPHISIIIIILVFIGIFYFGIKILI